MPQRSKCMSRCRICLCTRVFLSPLLLCKFKCIIPVSPPLLYRSTTHIGSPTCKKCEYLDVLSASPNPERLPYPRGQSHTIPVRSQLKIYDKLHILLCSSEARTPQVWQRTCQQVQNTNTDRQFNQQTEKRVRNKSSSEEESSEFICVRFGM